MCVRTIGLYDAYKKISGEIRASCASSVETGTMNAAEMRNLSTMMAVAIHFYATDFPQHSHAVCLE